VRPADDSLDDPADDPTAEPFGPEVARFDAAVDAWFDQHRGNPAADRLFYLASALGDHGLIWHLAGLARAAVPGADAADALRLSVTLGVESAVVNLGVKSLFRRGRPVHEGERPHGLRRPLTSSFPSGHASAAFLAAVMLSEGRPLEAPLWFGLAGVVSASRVYVKVHHASDVVAGAAIGVALGAVATRVWRRFGATR
jgi:membrane-associated phospholipid phosphatase